jgi:hypothetical protein
MKIMLILLFVSIVCCNINAQKNDKVQITESIRLLNTHSSTSELKLTTIFKSSDFSELAIQFEMVDKSVDKSSNSYRITQKGNKQIGFNRRKLRRDILLTLNIDGHNYYNYVEIKKFVKDHLRKVKKLSKLDKKLVKNGYLIEHLQ